LEAYRKGCGDLHRDNAARLYEKPLGDITEELRKIGKTVNFSLINGQTEKGLAAKLNIHPDEARLFIDDFYERYPKVASWIKQMLQIAREQGHVTSLYGRRRHLPALNSRYPFEVAHAERQVISGIIQATGAELFKWMLGRLSEKLPPEFHMILPIHDALLFEIPEKRIEEAKTLIREVMQESPPRFSIPLAVNICVGKNWQE
jgi:DNA polymerase I